MPHGPITYALLLAFAEAMVEWGSLGPERAAHAVWEARGEAWVRRQLGAAPCVPWWVAREALVGHCCAEAMAS